MRKFAADRSQGAVGQTCIIPNMAIVVLTKLQDTAQTSLCMNGVFHDETCRSQTGGRRRLSVKSRLDRDGMIGQITSRDPKHL